MSWKTKIAVAAVVGFGGLGAFLYWMKMDARPVSVAGQICNDDRECLEQGWDEEKRGWWYTVSQGSRLYPLSWWNALEVADSEVKFASNAHMLDRLGYIANVADNNPHQLPLGFVTDQDSSPRSKIMCGTFPETCSAGTMAETWVGMNCSACHTNEITLGDAVVRVDGAPTMADFQALEETLHAATKATLEDEAKWQRFAAEVLGADAGADKVASLKTQVQEQSDWQARLEEKNATPGYRYGHGRLDAQGHILNKVAILQGNLNDGKAVMAGKEDLFDFEILANGPSSYPFIWNTSQQKFIQWNGIATNTARLEVGGRATDPGALIRNVSEVIGVFAHIEADDGPASRGYKSTLRMKNMIDLEQELMTLQSPQWPSSFPPIDTAAAERGKALFVENCASCHAHLEPTDVTGPAGEQMHTIMEFGQDAEGNLDEKVALSPAMTDPLLVCNTYFHGSKAGNQAGQKTFVFKEPVIKDLDVTRNMLVNATFGTIIGKVDELAESVLEDTFGFGAPRRPAFSVGPGLEAAGIDYMPGLDDFLMKAFVKMCAVEAAELMTTADDDRATILSYKARPLNGIWATAPYLHNGSVPTLYDLLLPSDMQVSTHHPVPQADTYRPAEFGVGLREFDPVKVGFNTDMEKSPFVFRTRTEDGQPIPGNYNSGHDYGNSTFSEQDRMDLVEYMKSL